MCFIRPDEGLVDIVHLEWQSIHVPKVIYIQSLHT